MEPCCSNPVYKPTSEGVQCSNCKAKKTHDEWNREMLADATTEKASEGPGVVRELGS